MGLQQRQQQFNELQILHQARVCGISTQQVKLKETSCYCDTGLAAEGFQGSATCGWTTVSILNEVSGPIDKQLAVHAKDWDAAEYEGNWYIGQVQQIDEDDGKIEVSFMTKDNGKTTENWFKWLAKTRFSVSFFCKNFHSPFARLLWYTKVPVSVMDNMVEI